MIRITRNLSLDESEIEEQFIRASGPGGQHVNKTATAVQLRFDAARSPSLPEEVRQRLLKLAGNRATDDGVVVIEARRFRSQERNRTDALGRLVALVRRATLRPKVRRKTKPTRASKERRLEEKRQRSRTKQQRRRVRPGEQ